MHAWFVRQISAAVRADVNHLIANKALTEWVGIRYLIPGHIAPISMDTDKLRMVTLIDVWSDQ